MRNIRKGALAAVAAMALAFTAACTPADNGTGGNNGGNGGGNGGGNTHTELAEPQINETPYDQVADGGTFTTAIGEITPQWNMFHGNMTTDTSTLWQWYNPQMAFYTPEGEWSFNENYLTDVQAEENEDGTVVTYTIREEAVFNDGTPIDWTAFEAVWKGNSGQEGYNANSTDGYDKIESVTAGENDKQAVVTFGTPWPWWKGLFNNILHPAAGEVDVFEQGYVDNPHPEWGAGPYKLESVDQASGTVTFVPNEKWWGDPGKLEKRIFRQMEAEATINAFLNGEIDAAGVGSADYYARVAERGDEFEIRTASRPATFLITLNSDSPNLSDVEVRKSIAMGINREQFAQVRFQGLNYTETPPGSFTLFPWQEGYKDSFGELAPYDPDAAKANLEAAGYTLNGEGIYEKDGQPLSLNYPIFGDSQLNRNTAQAMQAMMQQIGVKVNVLEKPSSDFSSTIAAKDFDFLLSGFASSDPFGVAYFCQIYCSDSSLNNSGTGSAEMDAKINEVATLPTAEEQIAAANELETELMSSFGLLPMFGGPTIVAVKPGLANYGAGIFYTGPVENVGWTE